MALRDLYMNDGGKSKVRCRFRADQSHFFERMLHQCKFM